MLKFTGYFRYDIEDIEFIEEHGKKFIKELTLAKIHRDCKGHIMWKNICNKFYYRRNAVLYVGNAELHFCFIGKFYERKVKKVDG